MQEELDALRSEVEQLTSHLARTVAVMDEYAEESAIKSAQIVRLEAQLRKLREAVK